MARDMQVDLLVNPIVDTKKFDAELKRLEKMSNRGVSGIGSRQGLAFQNLATRLMTSLIVSGRASTPTQSRMIIESALGRMSGGTRSLLRGAQNISDFVVRSGRVMPYGSFSERQIRGWRTDLAGTAGAYNAMLNSYAAFKSAPSEQSKDALLKAVLAVNAQLSNINKERKTEIKTFAKIEKDTQAIHKEATDWRTLTKPSETTSALGAAAFLKSGFRKLLSMFGLGTMVGAAKKWVDLGLSGIKQGSRDLEEQAIYGAQRNIAIGRARAKMYGLDESLTGAPERYALDFQQRMKWGQVSDMEWIALSRMGELGRKIMRGETGESLQKSIEDYIAKNRGNEAEVRFMLQQLGISPSLMKYGVYKYQEGDVKELTDAYAEVIQKQKDHAIAIWETADDINKAIAEVRETAADFLANVQETKKTAPRIATARRLAGYSDIERGRAYPEEEKDRMLLAALQNRDVQGLARLMGVSTGVANSVLNDEKLRQEAISRKQDVVNVYNTIHTTDKNTTVDTVIDSNNARRSVIGNNITSGAY